MEEKSKQIIRWSIGISAAFILVAIAWGYFDFDRTRNSNEWNNPGVRGDFIGGHTALAAGFASTILFGGALLLQSIELAETRKVAQQQANAITEQQEQIKQQTKTSIELLSVTRRQVQELENQNRIANWQNLTVARDHFYGVVRPLVHNLVEDGGYHARFEIARSIVDQISQMAMFGMREAEELSRFVLAQLPTSPKSYLKAAMTTYGSVGQLAYLDTQSGAHVHDMEEEWANMVSRLMEEVPESEYERLLKIAGEFQKGKK